MPKRRRDRSVSCGRSRASPLSNSSHRSKKPLLKNPLENEANAKEWEEARCPVCIEHPHNAVLLLCSSHDKGCRPFMCDTSYRHSNCFDQFCKSAGEEASSEGLQQVEPPSLMSELPSSSAVREVARGEDGPAPMHRGSCVEHSKPKLVCPLCRGQITGWVVVESARSFMDAKSRSCACETCDFSGTYVDLRKHARQVHPLARPADADPERQCNWRRLEQQRDLGDLLSTLQSSFREERNEDGILTFDEGGLLTVFFLVRILRPGSSSRSSSRSGSSRSSRARAHVTIRRRATRAFWGQTYNWDSESRDDGDDDGGDDDDDADADGDGDDNEASDGGSPSSEERDRVRRRSTTPERKGDDTALSDSVFATLREGVGL